MEDEEAKKQETVNPEDLTKIDSSSKILDILMETINEKFSDRFLVYQHLWKTIIKKNKFIDSAFKSKMKQIYQEKKSKLIEQFVEFKVEQCITSSDNVSSPKELKVVLENLYTKYISKVSDNEKRDSLLKSVLGSMSK